MQYRKQLKDIGAFTVTAETIRQILQWLNKCSNDHGTCQQYQHLGHLTETEKGLPLRLIDVDPNGEYLGDVLQKTNRPIDQLCYENAPHACIKDSQEVVAMANVKNRSGVQYLTLSHRWSDSMPNGLNWESMA